MKNPLKRLQALFKPAARRSGLDPDLSDKVDYTECQVIWPNGTWKSKLMDPCHWPDLDVVVRGVLLKVWANEAFYAAEAAAGHRLNPGMFGSYPQSVQKGWRPSEKVLKHVWARENWSTGHLHYVVAQLQHSGRLAA
jgi:hypothetical protein